MLEKSDPFSFIRKISGKVLLNAFLLVAVLVIFFRFTDKNSDRILLQNENYIKSATVQTSRRLNDMFTNAKNSIETIAYLYSQNLDSPQSGHRNLKILTGSGLGMFDAVEFADRNGISRDSGGKTTPVAAAGISGKACRAKPAWMSFLIHRSTMKIWWFSTRLSGTGARLSGCFTAISAKG